jgi:hypothetical protein
MSFWSAAMRVPLTLTLPVLSVHSLARLIELIEQDRQIENIEKKKDADFIGRIPSVPFTDGRFGMLDGLDVQRDWRTSASDGWDGFILAWIPLN